MAHERVRQRPAHRSKEGPTRSVRREGSPTLVPVQGEWSLFECLEQQGPSGVVRVVPSVWWRQGLPPEQQSQRRYPLQRVTGCPGRGVESGAHQVVTVFVAVGGVDGMCGELWEQEFRVYDVHPPA